MRELIKEIWSTSKRNKLRTSLTGFAVAWGIFMLIFLLGAGNGLINAQLQQSTRFLANSMRVFPGETSKAYKGLKEGRSITLNDKDILISNQTYGQYVDDVGGRLEHWASPNLHCGRSMADCAPKARTARSYASSNRIRRITSNGRRTGNSKQIGRAHV